MRKRKPKKIVRISSNGFNSDEENLSSDDIPLGKRFNIPKSKQSSAKKRKTDEWTPELEIEEIKAKAKAKILARKLRKKKSGESSRLPPKKSPCPTCGEKFRHSELIRHEEEHKTKPPIPCESCDKIFICIFAWHRHGYKLHGKQLRCDECEKMYTDVDRFIRHLRYGHAEKTYVCTVCNSYSTSVNARLRKHVEQTHMKQYVAFCDICNKGFFDKTYLEEHKNLHSGDTPHQCELCGKSFRLKTTLRAHRFKFHLELFPYVCDLCKKGFATKNGLDAHMDLHAENRQYICDFCGKHLTTVATLTEHRRMHTGEFPFKCDICSKAFRAKKHLTRHMASHSGAISEKNHECHYCNKKFTNVTACLQHTQKCHGNYLEFSVNPVL